jgi:hypothetical protein
MGHDAALWARDVPILPLGVQRAHDRVALLVMYLFTASIWPLSIIVMSFMRDAEPRDDGATAAAPARRALTRTLSRAPRRRYDLPPMIPILHLNLETERRQVESLLDALRLNPRKSPSPGPARQGRRGGREDPRRRRRARRRRVVESSREIRRPEFHRRADPRHAEEMKSAAGRVVPEVMAALRDRSRRCASTKSHIMPEATRER